MTKSEPRQRTLETAEVSRPRRRTPTSPEPPYQSQQDVRNDTADFNPYLDWGQRDLKGNRQDTHNGGSRQPRPQPLQLKKTGLAIEDSFSVGVQGEGETPGFAHLRRNAISAGVSLDDYRYPNGQPSRRELTEESLRTRSRKRTLDNCQPLPPGLVSPANSLTSSTEAIDGDNMDENLKEETRSALPLKGVHPWSSKSTDRGTKRKDR